MAKKRKAHQQAPSKFHGDMSKRPGKATKPSDHMAHNIPDPDGGLFQGKNLGTQPEEAPVPQTMQGPAQYPGQEMGA